MCKYCSSVKKLSCNFSHRCPSRYHYISSMWGRSGRGGVGVVCSCSTTPQHCGAVSFWCVPVTCSTSPHHHCGTVVRSCSTTSALWSCGTVVVTVVLWYCGTVVLWYCGSYCGTVMCSCRPVLASATTTSAATQPSSTLCRPAGNNILKKSGFSSISFNMGR